MVERQIARGELVAAVLATVVVARVDVGTGERHVVEAPLDLDVAKQADDRRQLEGDGDGVDLAVVLATTSTLPWHHSVTAFCQWTILSGSYDALRRSVCSMRVRFEFCTRLSRGVKREAP